ncbi:Arginine transport ATP-binding protein ArtM [bacterium HR12]|nr:Arginine transport ATP-binding protein ArtM [bacterium HR12]
MTERDREVVVRVEDLHKSFGHLEVLRGINMEVHRGEVVVVFGRSGSGKSTLLRCINFLEDPTRGTIEVAGIRLEGGHRTRHKRELIRQLRIRTGMVFQQFNLFPHMSVLDNVTEGPVIVKREARKEVEVRARDLLAQMGLEGHEHKRPAQLSGGKMQRVAIARALAMHPKLMLFDEPTSALDPELVGEVLKAMSALARSGMTMVIVTHELGFAFEIANRVVFLDEGTVAADGSPHDVLLKPEHPRLKSFVNRFHETADMLRPFLEKR